MAAPFHVVSESGAIRLLVSVLCQCAATRSQQFSVTRKQWYSVLAVLQFCASPLVARHDSLRGARSEESNTEFLKPDHHVLPVKTLKVINPTVRNTCVLELCAETGRKVFLNVFGVVMGHNSCM
ncbi:hypothetical protein BaRGS_00038202 [Batillaria attramentaria]|uniref:Secreted protein n=1 Tax=Batillaria attramentaria TaxID=370345 RepID=A0ABD0J6T9_9CAEN